MENRMFLPALLITAAASQVVLAQGPPKFTVTVLPQLDANGFWTEPQAISSSGAVVGRVGSPNSLGFFWSEDTGANLLQPEHDDIAEFIWANAINASGEIAGSYRPYGGSPFGVAFHISSDGTFTSLPDPGQDSLIWGARGMNDHGMVVGSSADMASGAVAVYWLDGEAFVIGSLGGAASAAAVNNNGLIVGTSKTATSLVDVPFVWSQETGMQALPSLVHDLTAEPYDVNDEGVAVGRAAISAFVNEAVYWDVDGNIHQLPKSGDPSNSAWATAINNAGVIVGYEVDSLYQPLIWIDGQVYRLHDLVLDLDEEIHLMQPMGINDAGEIAVAAAAPGEGDIFQQTITVILRPGVEPSLPGDLNGDGVVDVSDLLILLGDWGPCPDGPSCAADFNGDGTVDVSDLLFLLSNWG